MRENNTQRYGDTPYGSKLTCEIDVVGGILFEEQYDTKWVRLAQDSGPCQVSGHMMMMICSHPRRSSKRAQLSDVTCINY